MELSLSFAVGLLTGIMIGFVIGTTSMKRGAGSGSSGAEWGAKSGARKVVLTTPNDARLSTAIEAQKKSKIFNLVWQWVSHESKYPGIDNPLGDGSHGQWLLRPLMAPTDVDVDQGVIIVHSWSERRLAWMPRMQVRTMKQLDAKLIEQGNNPPATREMLAHFFERVIIAGAGPEHPQAREGPQNDGTWPNLGEVLNGIDITDRGDDGPEDESAERELDQITIKTERDDRILPRPKNIPRAKEFNHSPYDGKPLRGPSDRWHAGR